MYLYLGKTVFKIKYFIYVMLVLAGIELTLSANKVWDFVLDLCWKQR